MLTEWMHPIPVRSAFLALSMDFVYVVTLVIL